MYDAWHAVQPEDIAIVQVSDTFGTNFSRAGDKVSLVGEVVNKDADGIVTARIGELCDEIYSNDFPRLVRSLLRLEVSAGVMSVFVALAEVTALNVGVDVGAPCGPPVVP